MTLEKVKQKIVELEKELETAKIEGEDIDTIRTIQDYQDWSKRALEKKITTKNIPSPEISAPPTQLSPLPTQSGLGVGGAPRLGVQKTEAERRATHEFFTGKTVVPPRGTGIGAIESIPLGPTLEEIQGTAAKIPLAELGEKPIEFKRLKRE